jgi:hypothetical protein
MTVLKRELNVKAPSCWAVVLRTDRAMAVSLAMTRLPQCRLTGGGGRAAGLYAGGLDEEVLVAATLAA